MSHRYQPPIERKPASKLRAIVLDCLFALALALVLAGGTVEYLSR
jgi:hypothetical protein